MSHVHFINKHPDRNIPERDADHPASPHKIGLIVEGGGMKCAYSAGILDRFLDDKITYPYCIGVSAGAGNLASYLAGQRGRNRRYFTTHLTERDYFGIRSLIRRGELFGLHYIYGTTTRSTGCDPLDFQKMMQNPADFILVATNAHTGKAAYFHKQDMSQDDYRVLMASCAIPAVCHPIEINGEKYYDGGVSDSIPIRRALADGCDKVVVLMTKPRGFIKKREAHRLGYTLLLHQYPEIIRDLNNRHIHFNESMNEMNYMEKEGKAFVFYPSQPMATGTYDMDTLENQKFYNLGKHDYDARRDELTAFLTS